MYHNPCSSRNGSSQCLGTLGRDCQIQLSDKEAPTMCGWGVVLEAK